MLKKFRKLRILWCGESSFLNTGYAVYAKEVLTRLYETDKYKIAELGCYASADNPAIKDIPWRFYPTLPLNEQEEAEYNANHSYQFGEWRFDDVCLDFRPDVVIDIRDWWMMEYQERSAYRKMYKWLIMPTVDSSPQQEQYLATYLKADSVFTYSEFGKECLESETSGNISVAGIASPGADFASLKPVSNKEQHRQQYGFQPGVNIIGTVMRNQRRKLYPNLIESFRKMIDDSPELQSNTYLYLHTSYPDLGWEIPYFIKKYNMGNHTLMTYKCRDCGNFFPSFYQGERTNCSRCNSNNAVMPNTAFGVTTQELGEIINWFDLYVQYSVCEGFGMPQVEAAACGVPCITVNYSAMESVGKKIKADFIEPKCFFWDSPTHSKRAIPDDEMLVKKMSKFIKLPRSMRSKKGMDAYMGVKKHYTWEKTAKVWENHLDTIEPLTHEETWDSKAKTHNPVTEIPNGLNNKDFVDWGINNIWGEPEKVDDYISCRLLRDLNNGKSVNHSANIYYNDFSYSDNQPNYVECNQQETANRLMAMCEYKNNAEEKRKAISDIISMGENKEVITDSYNTLAAWNQWRPEFLSKVKPDENNTNMAD